MGSDIVYRNIILVYNLVYRNIIIEKCTMLIRKSEKRESTEGIELPNQGWKSGKLQQLRNIGHNQISGEG